jgi:hypothetical protein
MIFTGGWLPSAAFIQVVWFLKSIVVLAFDSRRRLSGKWLLCIKDQAGKPFKFDIYRMRQRKRSISGSIRRVRSLEDPEQENRRYELQGYAEGDHLVYVFWPTTETTQSFGNCTLVRKSDNYYSGVYTRPYLNAESDDKCRTADIVLARSEAKVLELISGLKDEKTKKRIWKAVHGWRSKLPSKSTAAEPMPAAGADEATKVDDVPADDSQNVD